MKNKKLVFTTKDEQGNDLELAVERPSPKVQIESQKVYNKAWRNAIDSGAVLRTKAHNILLEQGLWSDEKDKEIEQLQKVVVENGKYLEEKQYGEDLDKGREVATTLQADRFSLLKLNSDRGAIDENTAEYQAEMERLNFLISACTVYNSDRKHYFSSLEDYYTRSNELASIESGTKFLIFINDIDSDFEAQYPENKFFKENEKPVEVTECPNLVVEAVE